MSKESLDYQKLCSNYYSSWEEGCCMESCEFYNHNECPVVYVNGLLEERDKTIADLEAKLAEKDKEIESLSSEISSLEQDLTHYKGEVYNLKDQLNEKEKEIERLEYTVDFYKSYYISFKEKVIDELEKVRSFAYNTFKEFGCFDETDLEHILDNKIEELKKVVE